MLKSFLEHDPVYADLFSKVFTYAEWAATQGLDRTDTGIDLVAKLTREEGYCAVQCKFYREDHRIEKKDIDSFFTASGKKTFTRRLIVDSTACDWSKNAEDALAGQAIPVTRLSLRDLEMSSIDWSVYARDNKVELKPGKQLRKHQIEALKSVEKKFRQEGSEKTDRGKLLMACGTGKTLTSLKIAERLVGKGGCVLYLVPSLALMSQTIRKWSHDAELQLRSFSVCSDISVGKRRARDDLSDITIHDLACPATTDASNLGKQFSRSRDGEKMSVVFSTYQSIQVISDAQREYGFPEFDLIVCDEAHRTTGATLVGEDESNFVKVHYQNFIKGKKRLYMTATPRIFADIVKTTAKEKDAVLCSMDDPELYGETFHEVSFSYAVENDLLTDYKVIVLAMDEEKISKSVQKRLTDPDSELVLDDVTKIIGCYRALAKLDLKDDLFADKEPMSQAVAFCKNIKSSKLIKEEFAEVVLEYLKDQSQETGEMIRCEVEHVDGTFNSKERGKWLDWLGDEENTNTCRILSNARCLSEGVDVPSLDAILFMHPRKSQIDVVQSVGRVMRRAEGKKMGYVILPVGIPADISPSEALNNNEKYRVVWQILNALRAHDDRLDPIINKIDLGVNSGDRMEIVAVNHSLPQKSSQVHGRKNDIGSGGASRDDEGNINDPPILTDSQMSFEFDEFNRAILAKIVQKCGTREYWEDWATDIAKIAQTHITRIKAILEQPGTEARKTFDAFLEEIQDDLNESITESDAIEMLSQHLITKPVFDTLFEGYSFSKDNPVSVAMQKVLDALQTHNLDNEIQSLEKFYQSVKMRASGIDSDAAKQKIILELYDKFFRNAFPSMTERLGIVYTPVELVDFIVHSVNDVLQSEFGKSLGSKGVHILDPFTGTGTFVTRLLQSELIKKEEIEQKYRNEIHANEIVLLAYYIAAINIESSYHSLVGGRYKPFEGICLTDTFQLYEKDDMISKILANNSDRRIKQKELDIRVIMANPPYRGSQKDAGDNLANVSYPKLEEGISLTYAANTNATAKNSLYNSFVKAFRWGSNRLGSCGVLAYVSSASFITATAMDGLRKCLLDEYSKIYIFNLRGDARTSGEQRRKESGNVFGYGSREPIAITIAVKNPDAKEFGKIYYHDIGDYLSREQKLDKVKKFNSTSGITEANCWSPIIPDQYNDWIEQRDDSFDEFIPIGDKKNKLSTVIFENYSNGLGTSRDAWCYNSSRRVLMKNMQSIISFYNSEVDRFLTIDLKKKGITVDDFVSSDKTKISWTSELMQNLSKGEKYNFRDECGYSAMYRPFFKQWAYFSRDMNKRVFQMPFIFPEAETRNRVIVTTGIGQKSGFSTLMTDHLPDLHMVGDSQCFPLKLYEKLEIPNEGLFGRSAPPPPSRNCITVKDGISDLGLRHFQEVYPNEKISKEDIFHYIYGLFHSEDYRTRYANNLSKQLPRIPRVKESNDFWALTEAGRNLGDLHVNYEDVEPYPVTFKEEAPSSTTSFRPEDFRVEKMKFGGKGKDKDRSTVIYNHRITMTNIPLEAYEYQVNGKPALEWVMERQRVKTDKDSGIVNDANDYAVETAKNPSYPLDLFRRIITVSLETVKIVRSLPKLDQFVQENALRKP